MHFATMSVGGTNVVARDFGAPECGKSLEDMYVVV